MPRLDLDTTALDQLTTDLRRHSAHLIARQLVSSHSDLSMFSTASGFRGVGLRLGRVSDFYSPEALDALTDRCCVSGRRG